MSYQGNETFLTIKQIIIRNLEIQRALQDLNAESFLQELGVNSIEFIKIVVDIESTFGFEFADDDLDANKFPTIQSLICYVEKRIHFNQ